MSELDENYPGVGRLKFFLGKVGLVAATMISVVYFGPGSSVTRVIALVVSIAGFVLDVMRLRNIGVSQWFAMLRFVPYVNLLYTIGLLSAQAGWIETRRLDRNGKTIAIFLIAMTALMLFMLLTVSIPMPLFF
jgi:uncharacterized membrane protein YhaH (DUF805 family)